MILRYILFIFIQPFICFIKDGRFLKWLKPNIGTPKDVNVIINKSQQCGTAFCSENNLGHQLCTYKIQNRKYFRLSFAKKIKKFVVIVQLGMSQHQYKYTFLNIKQCRKS